MARRYNYFDDESLEAPKPSLSEQMRMSVQQEDKKRKRVKQEPTNKVSLFLRYIFSVVFGSLRKSFGKVEQQIEKDRGTKRGKAKAILTGFISMFLAIVIMITGFIVSSNRMNSKKERFNSEAYKVCTEYLSKYGNANYTSMKSEYGIGEYMTTGVTLVREIDFDNNGISELLVVYNSSDNYYAEIWSFVGKNFQKIYSRQLVNPRHFRYGIWLSLYTKGKETYIVEHNKKDVEKVSVYAMKNNNFRYKFAAKYNRDDYTFKVDNKNQSDNFERVKFMLLSESRAANMSDDVMDTIDSFADSKTKKTSAFTVTDINTAYYKIIDEYTRNYGVATVIQLGTHYSIKGVSVVDLIDFDNDGTKELVLIYRRSTYERSEDEDGNYKTEKVNKFYCDIYTFKDNEARLVYQTEGMSNKENDNEVKYFLTKRRGNKTWIYVNTFSSSNFGRVVKASSKSLAFDGEKFKQKTKASYVTEYGYTDYYWDGDYVYKSTFENKGGFAAPFFDGKEDYDSSVWDVTYVKVKARDKKIAEDQVSKTESVIKSINSEYNPSNF